MNRVALLQSNERPLLLDGALGTELERRGVDTTTPGWTSIANITHPDLVRTIHEEYIRAGADIITANTFRSNGRAHRSSGYNASELTFAAIEHAKHARAVANRNVLIAGSIAPVADCFSPELVPEDDSSLFEEHHTMARWMVDAGVDLILIETMNTIREACIALRAARAATELPIIVSLVLRDEEQLLDGSSLIAAVQLLRDADMVAVNCISLSLARKAVPKLSEASAGVGLPVGIYPNMSEVDTMGKWQLIAHSDKEMAAFFVEAAMFGAAMIGTCCGSTPTTTAAIHGAFAQLSKTTWPRQLPRPI